MKSLHDLRDGLDRILLLVVLLGDDMASSLARQGLTVARAHLVWHLHHHGPATQRVLADALHVTPRNITGLVDGLVEGGYVAREPHPTDRRARLVSLTEQGTATLASMDAAHRELAERLLGGLAPEDLDAFLRGLDHVIARLREELGR